MVYANITIDNSYNIIVSIYDETITTIEAGKYVIVVVGES
jgi:hypothetical protein